MIKYVFCYSKICKWTFLDSTLGLSELQKLRFNKQTYAQILEDLDLFKGSKFIYLAEEVPNTLQKINTDITSYLVTNNCYLEEDDSVVVLNLIHFPRNLALLKSKLAQADVASMPLVIRIASKNKEMAAIVFKVGNFKGQKLPVDLPVYEAPSEAFSNLNSSSDIVDLFNAGLVLRNFNSMSMGRAGYFFKHSMQKNKMQAEHEFLDNLPTAIRPFYPCCGDYKENSDGSAGYEIELVPTLDTAKFLINNYFSSINKCNLLLDCINSYLNAVPTKQVEPELYKATLIKSFIDKGETRLKAMAELPCINKLNQITNLFGWEDAVTFGKAYLKLLKTNIEGQTDKNFYYAHGDLFFGNMLFDPAKKVLKLIDPKGGSADQAWQPKWYDLAKLSHSFLGNYDLMVYGLVTPVMNKELSLSLQIHPDYIETCHYLSESFRAFLKNHRIDINDVRLYEGSLFLSMIPLHSEAPLRMSCQLIKAIEIYNEITSND